MMNNFYYNFPSTWVILPQHPSVFFQIKVFRPPSNSLVTRLIPKPKTRVKIKIKFLILWKNSLCLPDAKIADQSVFFDHVRQVFVFFRQVHDFHGPFPQLEPVHLRREDVAVRRRTLAQSAQRLLNGSFFHSSGSAHRYMTKKWMPK